MTAALRVDGAVLTLFGSELPGLDLTNAEIEAGSNLVRARWTGELLLVRARIGGASILDEAVLGRAGEPGERALDGAQLTVAQVVLARDGFTCHGELRLDSADIGGSVRSMTGLTRTEPARTEPGELADDLRNLTASGDRSGAPVDVPGARMDGMVRGSPDRCRAALRHHRGGRDRSPAATRLRPGWQGLAGGAFWP